MPGGKASKATSQLLSLIGVPCGTLVPNKRWTQRQHTRYLPGPLGSMQVLQMVSPGQSMSCTALDSHLADSQQSLHNTNKQQTYNVMSALN